MYKERVQHSEETPIKIYYTDRQGVPGSYRHHGKEGKEQADRQLEFFLPGAFGQRKEFPHELRRAPVA